MSAMPFWRRAQVRVSAGAHSTIKFFRQVGRLATLTADNSAQGVRVAELRRLTARRFAVLETAIAETRSRQFSKAAIFVSSPGSRSALDQFVRKAAEIRSVESSLLGQRTLRSQSIQRLANAAIAASTFLAILLALFVIRESRAKLQSLAEARLRAEGATQAKSTFLSNMSHEIRTPMNGMLGFAELLMANELSSEQRVRAEQIDSSGRAMMRLLNDILDFSKMEAGQMQLAREPFDVAHALKACVNLMEPAAIQKGLSLSIELPSNLPKLLLGDGLRLRQIVLNLLGNAVKFTDEGSVQLLVLPSAVGRDYRLKFEVRDTGLGIAPDRQHQVFQEFAQADSRIARRAGGTGLGLAITMQLVRLMQGELELESSLAHGSVFRVALPLAVHCGSAIPASDPENARTIFGEKGRILVVEDHDVNQQLALGILTHLGWQADLAINGHEAVEMVQKASESGGAYRLVLMDMQMPVMDGLEATRKLRSEGYSAERLPIVMLTANAYERDVAASYAAGAQAHLSKPIQMLKLDQALRRLLGKQDDVQPMFQPSSAMQEQYKQRKMETLEALDAMIDGDRFSDGEVSAVADLLHKLAGTAALFGQAELGDRARAFETELPTWIGPDRVSKIRSRAAAIKQAA